MPSSVAVLLATSDLLKTSEVPGSGTAFSAQFAGVLQSVLRPSPVQSAARAERFALETIAPKTMRQLRVLVLHMEELWIIFVFILPSLPANT